MNIADRQGMSPLHLAESRGYREMAEILKRRRRSADARDDTDRSLAAAGAAAILANR